MLARLFHLPFQAHDDNFVRLYVDVAKVNRELVDEAERRLASEKELRLSNRILIEYNNRLRALICKQIDSVDLSSVESSLAA